VPQCPQCGKENPAEARFCLACGSPLSGQAASGREVRKTVTVVFSDVTGSTSLGEERDPESVRRVMARYFEQARAALERHGGTVEKFIGDAVMAVFGIPTLHEDDALRAVRAAAELRERLTALNEELERDWGVRVESRTGVNTGNVVAGNAETLVTGDAVNVAARLEQLARPGEVLLGETTYRLVRDAVSVEATEPLQVKGKRESVRAYRLLAVRPDAVGHERRLDSPMVGRERQLALLSQAFDNAVGDRASQLFTVLGTAGVGKTRLVDEFVRSLAAEASVLRGRCLPYGDGITFWPLAEVVREAAAITDGDDSVHARDKIASLLSGEENAGVVADRVAALTGLAEGGADDPEEGRWAVRKLFERLARGRPLVVVFDDIHSAEPAFLDVVEHVADWSREAPIVLVCLARPELLDVRPAWGGGKLNATSVLLAPLSDDECSQLIANLLDRADLDRRVQARIIEAAEGNPLFVEEMLAMLIDDGLLGRSGDRWIAAADAATVSVPPTIRALLAARLDRLDGDERSVLERASVEGRVFHRGALLELVDDDVRPTADHRLSMLVRRELIGPEEAQFSGDEAFRFRHLLIRDVAYESMPKELRAALHERFADWLERRAGDRFGEYEEVAAHHLEQAYRHAAELGPVTVRERALAGRAATLMIDAARRASDRGDVGAQVSFLRRATDLLPSDDSTRVAALVELGTVIAPLEGYGRAEEFLTAAADAAAATGDERLRQHALLELSMRRGWADPASRAVDWRELAERAIVTFEQEGDHAGLARAWRHLGLLHQIQLRWDAERAALETALAFAGQAEDEREARSIRTGIVTSMVWGPMPVPEALDRLEQMYAEVRLRPLSAANTLEGIAHLRAMQGEFDEARRLLAEERFVLTDLGQPFRIATAGLTAGPVELLANAPAAAETLLRESCDVLEAHGETGVRSTVLGFRAEALYRLGRYDEAERSARDSETNASVDDLLSQAIWRSVSAKVAARRGDLETALALGGAAVDLLEGSDGLDVRGDVLLNRAEVHGIVGRPDAAKADVGEALALYERKGNVVSAERARRALERAGLELA
jgi:class 3 adenylate cyclase/tetratricopeptide (TPR) repeat protein